SDLTAAGTEPITVVNGGPGGGTSGSQTFTINNPVPPLTSISANNTLVGSGFQRHCNRHHISQPYPAARRHSLLRSDGGRHRTNYGREWRTGRRHVRF